MPNLKKLLYSDLRRQLELEKRTDARPIFLSFLGRLLHPRFLPVVICRSARESLLRRIPLIPKILTYLNIVLFGLEVSPRCEIGPGIFFPHTSGTVVGAVRIGSNAIIFQGVTLGAKELDMTYDDLLRPRLGDNVILGSGCKVLGSLTIGHNVTIGANSVVVDSIESNTTVAGIPARALNEKRIGVQ